MFNCELDLGDVPRVHDTTLHDVTVDVKTYKWKNPSAQSALANLLVPLNKKHKQCEIYVQMLGAMPAKHATFVVIADCCRERPVELQKFATYLAQQSFS